MTRARLALVLAAFAAGCGPASDHFAIHLTLTQGDTDRCPSSVCTGIPLSCNAVVSVRVVDAVDPSTVYLSKCLPLPLNEAMDLCALDTLDLGVNAAVPNRMVRVEVLIWPEVDVPDLACPTNVEFDARGMPESVATQPNDTGPAIGGQVYFRAGSGDVAEVPLGCPDLPALNDATCLAAGTVSITAAVDDFDTGVSLPVSLADTVTVGVGEPIAHLNPQTQAVQWELQNTDVIPLPRNLKAVVVPSWQDKQVTTSFQRAACVQVLEEGTQETPTITCHTANKSSTVLDLRAFRLAKSTLGQAFTVLRLPGVPDQGLVVGMVVDADGNPLAGATVTPSTGTINYLSADRTMIDPGDVTTSSGMFVSRDAPFDATWQANDGHGNGPSHEDPVVGGLVVNKATVVFIQIAPPPTN